MARRISAAYTFSDSDGTVASDQLLRGRTHWPDSNPIPCDDTKSPAEVWLRLHQCQGDVGGFFGKVGNQSEQDDPASGRKSSAEDELAEILVEGQKDSLAFSTEGGYFLIRDTGAFFGH